MGQKKIFSTRIDESLIRNLKHLAVDANSSLGKLLEEAIQDLLKKYELNTGTDDLSTNSPIHKQQNQSSKKTRKELK